MCRALTHTRTNTLTLTLTHTHSLTSCLSVHIHGNVGKSEATRKERVPRTHTHTHTQKYTVTGTLTVTLSHTLSLSMHAYKVRGNMRRSCSAHTIFSLTHTHSLSFSTQVRSKVRGNMRRRCSAHTLLSLIDTHILFLSLYRYVVKSEATWEEGVPRKVTLSGDLTVTRDSLHDRISRQKHEHNQEGTHEPEPSTLMAVPKLSVAADYSRGFAGGGSVLQCVAVCCSVLQCVAV